MAKKPKFPTVYTPVGTAFRAHVREVDPHPKYGGKFCITLAMEDTEEARQWIYNTIALGSKVAEAEGIKIKKVFKSPFKLPEDDDEDVWEGFKGMIRIDAKSNAKYPPSIVDSVRKPLPKAITVSGGDKVRLGLQLVPYDGLGSGYSFRLQAVQLVEKRDRTNVADGFPEEEGYVYEPDPDDEANEESFATSNDARDF